jgi:hypothetical protein
MKGQDVRRFQSHFGPLRSWSFAVWTAIPLLCNLVLTSCGGGGANGARGSPPPPTTANPAPAIVSLSPASTTAGGAPFMLTVTGYNFISTSLVQWNGSPRTTIYSSSTQLQAQISASDITSSGAIEVSVVNPVPGGGSSGSARFDVFSASNPAPSLLSLNPSSVDAGSSGLILTLHGANFIPSSTIYWNGVGVSTTYLSGTQLEAQIPPSALLSSGFAAVTVLNPAPGGGMTTPQFFAINYRATVVNQLASDLVWDAANQLMYLSVPSFASSYGNTVAALNPLTGTITNARFAGSEPDVLALSDDNQFLYAALDGSSSVRRFLIPGIQPDINYSLGADQRNGPYFAVDMHTAPAFPHTAAVSRGNFLVSPYALGGMAIFDDATQRSNTANNTGDLYDSFEWGSATNIYAINSEISSFDLYVLSVNSGGVTRSRRYQNEFSSFYSRMHYDKGTGFVYTDDGYVINPATGSHVGAFPAAGYMVPDSTLNRAFFLGQTQFQLGSNSYTIVSFNLTTFTPIAEIVVSNIRGYPLQFIRWGTNGLALCDDAGYIYLINDSFVGRNMTQAPTLGATLFPVQRSWPASRTQSLDHVRHLVRSNSRQEYQSYRAAAQANPAPTISSLSPSAIALGAIGIDGFTLTVTGSNFVSLSVVEWNGSPRHTQFISSTELQAQITFADVQNAGSALVSVVTPSPGGGTSNTLILSIVSQSLVAAPVIVSLYPNSVAAGSAGFTLQVNANWATGSSVVKWNGSPRPTSYIGGLQVQISAQDVASAGYAQVTVFTPGPGGGTSNPAQFQILYQPTTINQSTNDILWDPINQVFYISIPSSASTHPNQVCMLSPAAGVITNCRNGSEPNVLAISDDSQFLYVGMDGNSSVQRYALPNLTPDISFSLGTQGAFALDIQVAPGAPHTTAVTIGTATIPKATGGITIYDDATARPVIAQGWGPASNLYDSLQWGADAGVLYAASSEGGGDFYTLSVNSSGVVLDQDYASVFWNPGRIHYHSANGLIYSDDGFHVINPSTGLPLGIFMVGGGWPMVPDSASNTVFLLSQYIWQSNANFTINLFDMTHFTLMTRVPFSTSETVFSRLGRFSRWGGGLVVSFKGGNIYLLSGTALH